MLQPSLHGFQALGGTLTLPLTSREMQGALRFLCTSWPAFSYTNSSFNVWGQVLGKKCRCLVYIIKRTLLGPWEPPRVRLGFVYVFFIWKLNARLEALAGRLTTLFLLPLSASIISSRTSAIQRQRLTLLIAHQCFSKSKLKALWLTELWGKQLVVAICKSCIVSISKIRSAHGELWYTFIPCA